MARPSPIKEWTQPDKLIVLEGWARDGLTNEQIAHNIGVNVGTLYKWKKESEEFSNALKKGKEVVDREVENALYKKAIGYEYEETITEIFEDGNGKKRKHVRKFKKYAHPDVTAQIFWLKNRKTTDWRDKRTFENDDDKALEKLDSILNGIKDNAESQAK